MSGFYIYQLRVQGQKRPFYIGKGRGGRYRSHWCERSLRENTHKNNTIKKALDAGLDVYSEILVGGLDEKEALRLECEWISYYGRRVDGSGCLTNMTSGGEGTSGYVPTEATRRRASEVHRGRKKSDTTRRRMSEAQRGRSLSSDTRRKLSEANTGKVLSAEQRRKMSAAHAGKVISQETRERMAAAKRGKVHSAETRRKMSEAAKQRHAARRNNVL